MHDVATAKQIVGIFLFILCYQIKILMEVYNSILSPYKISIDHIKTAMHRKQ